MGVRKMIKVPATVEKALEHLERFGYPVELTAAFVVGGWVKTASNEDEFRTLFEEGKTLSPVGEVLLSWKMHTT